MSQEDQSTQPSQPQESRFNPGTEWFPVAVAALAQPINTVELTRLLGSRASYSAVKNWRLGRRGAPQWAVDRLADILTEQAESRLKIAAAKQAGVGSSGKWGTIALHNYRRQRALEKERAGA